MMSSDTNNTAANLRGEPRIYENLSPELQHQQQQASNPAVAATHHHNHINHHHHHHRPPKLNNNFSIESSELEMTTNETSASASGTNCFVKPSSASFDEYCNNRNSDQSVKQSDLNKRSEMFSNSNSAQNYYSTCVCVCEGGGGAKKY